MRHRVKKIRLGLGRDAGNMTMRKLLNNFFTRGNLKASLKRIKTLKSEVEKTVEKAKEENFANRNYLLKKVNLGTTIDLLFKQIGPALKGKTGGYVRIIKLGQRNSDGTETARLEWAYPVILEQKNKK